MNRSFQCRYLWLLAVQLLFRVLCKYFIAIHDEIMKLVPDRPSQVSVAMSCKGIMSFKLNCSCGV